MWKIVSALLILGSVSQSEALDCMYCNHTSVTPNNACVQGRAPGYCSGATHCVTYFGNITFSKYFLLLNKI